MATILSTFPVRLHRTKLSMSPPEENKPAKKRIGRKRKPPLPLGPDYHFVVATNPAQFKDDRTMRHVRSHVMYKLRGVSPAESSKGRDKSRYIGASSRTPSPTMLPSTEIAEDGQFLSPTPHQSHVWGIENYRFTSRSPSVGPMRSLVSRIVAKTSSASSSDFTTALSYPYELEDLQSLKDQYALNSDLFCAHDVAWINSLCENEMSFISHVSVVCVYQDLSDRQLEDTPLTVHAKSNVISMLTSNTQTDDVTILSITHFLIADIGGRDEVKIDLHQNALLQAVHQRGGIRHLGMYGSISAFVTVVLLTFAVLRGHPEPTMIQGFVPNARAFSVLPLPQPLSPLYAPIGTLSPLHQRCSDGTYEILKDTQSLTSSFLAKWNIMRSVLPPSADAELAAIDLDMDCIYTRLLARPSTEMDHTPDWKYEACRLAALIYCRSIVRGASFSDSGSQLHVDDAGASTATTTLLTALHNAIERTDTRLYWSELCGVYLWVCFVGGAASYPLASTSTNNDLEMLLDSAWVRKSFALRSIQASLAFEQMAEVVEAQRTMLQVQHLICIRGGL